MLSPSLTRFSNELTSLIDLVSSSIVGIEHQQGAGSGFVLTPDGYLLTNNHVVGGAQSVRVSFHDGEILEGQVLGRDKKTDLAVIRVEHRSALAHLNLIDKRRVQVGQIVIAIGNPFRFERSVSWGVVSALDRSLPAGKNQLLLEGLIQTDAAINPGNSGGPLISTEAEVIGINTAIVPFAQGLGFAVPAYTAHWVIGELISKGRVHRRFLGISARSVDLPIRLNPSGEKQRVVYIAGVEPHTPASRHGLQTGDLLLKADEVQLWNMDDLQRVLALGKKHAVRFELIRNQKPLTLEITPEDYPAVA